MPYKLENVNLARNSLYISHIYDSIFLEDFNSNFLACEDMRCQLNLPECAFSNRFALNYINGTKNVITDSFATCWIEF